MKVLRIILFPFSVLYGMITYVRNVFFDLGILKMNSFDKPIIAVGNLSVGGTGKTPQIEYLVRLLQDKYKIAILSRGYKRKTKGYIQLNDSHKVADVGDEPLQFFNKFGADVVVAVDTDRTNGVQQLEKSVNPDIFLLDDAFQHRKLKASTYILLTSYNDLYVDDYMLPTGNLREFASGASRANIIIVTKCPVDMSGLERAKIKERLRLKGLQQLFFTKIVYDGIIKDNKRFDLSVLKDKKILLVTGIANPEPLTSYLKSNAIDFKHLKYPDHYNFSKNDIYEMNKIDSELMLTTEKDFVRLHNKIENLCFIDIRTSFFDDEVDFCKVVNSRIKI